MDHAFKDFVLGRIDLTRKSDLTSPPKRDHEWETFVTVRFQAHPALNAAQQRALAMDFGMRRGVGTLQVRKAMQLYAEVYLGIAQRVPERFIRA